MTSEEQKQVMLNILIEFSKFCDEHNLMYFLDAGTLIGAVRHNGFIPWDDDIDVNMPQVDYDKFIELTRLSNGYLTGNIRVEYPEDSIYPFLKISDIRTVLIEYPERYPLEVGVYMDIFPKYGIENKNWKSKLLCKCTESLWLLHHFNRYLIYEWAMPGQNILKKLVSWTFSFFFKDSMIAVKLQDTIMHKYARRHPIDKCKYVTTLTNGEYQKLAPRRCFDGFQWLEFEGMRFKGPIDYDTYLHCLYKGDYMQLPPKDKRICHNTLAYWKN